jgi:hypothetical protein
MYTKKIINISRLHEVVKIKKYFAVIDRIFVFITN